MNLTGTGLVEIVARAICDSDAEQFPGDMDTWADAAPRNRDAYRVNARAALAAAADAEPATPTAPPPITDETGQEIARALRRIARALEAAGRTE